MHCHKVDVLGNRDGAVVVVLASHQCGPSLMSARCHMWVEFDVGSHLTLRSPVFLVFLSPQNPTSPNSNSTRKEDPHEK